MMKAALHLPNVLRTVAALVVVAMMVRYVLLDSIMAPPFITIILLVVLSFTFGRWPKTSASLALVPGFLIPVGVYLGYRSGDMEIQLVIFDWIVFFWVIVSATNFLVRPQEGRGDK